MTDKKTLEEALAEMEASNAKTAELRTKNDPQLMAEAAALTALSARLDALPQAQRRKVLDAAGLKHVSAAPPPIVPLRGSSYTSPSKATKPIDWEHWGFMRDGEVPLWQAVALSVNTNPDDMKTFEKAGDAFEKRLSIAASHAKARRLPVVYFVQNERVTPVILGQFAAWAVNVGITNMPPELVAMAATETTAAPAHQTPAPENIPTETTAYPEIKKEGFLLKRKALVAKYSSTWPDIESDLNHASENGLSEAAKGTKHGDWFESSVLAWGDQRGKRDVNQGTPVSNSIFNLPGTKYTKD